MASDEWCARAEGEAEKNKRSLLNVERSRSKRRKKLARRTRNQTTATSAYLGDSDDPRAVALQLRHAKQHLRILARSRRQIERRRRWPTDRCRCGVAFQRFYNEK
jgi:hypothetical protein